MSNRNLETLPAAVAEMAQISLTGNIVPPMWFKTITFENGKPDTNSILILSDIAYWYRPSVVRCERSGSIIGQKKKFAEDMLRRSYADLEEQFGLSKKQSRDCLIRLENLGVIRRVLRNINTSTGMRNNVLYIDLLPSVLQKLTDLSAQSVDILDENTPSNFKVTRPLHQSYQGGDIDVTTIKEHRLPSEISSKNTPLSSGDSRVDAFFAPKKMERENFSNSKKMIEIWNDLIPEKIISGANSYLSKQLESALRDQLDGDLSSWKSVCENFNSSKFLMGEAKNQRMHPSLSWLLDPKEPRVSRVFQKQHYTFGDRKMETKAIDFDSAEQGIEAMDEPKISKDVRLFIFHNNPAFYKSYVETATVFKNGEELHLIAPSGLARDKIQEQCYNALSDFLKHRYQLELVIKTKEEEASYTLKEYPK